jgi:hypothetical protein
MLGWGGGYAKLVMQLAVLYANFELQRTIHCTCALQICNYKGCLNYHTRTLPFNIVRDRERIEAIVGHRAIEKRKS